MGPYSINLYKILYLEPIFVFFFVFLSFYFPSLDIFSISISLPSPSFCSFFFFFLFLFFFASRLCLPLCWKNVMARCSQLTVYDYFCYFIRQYTQKECLF